jgi:hypothetical protein
MKISEITELLSATGSEEGVNIAFDEVFICLNLE